MSKFQSHDDYIANAPEEFRTSLHDLRTALAAALPDCEELIAYDMPGFGKGSAIATGYAAFSKQCGLYVSKEAISEYSTEIAALGFKHTKTGITFRPSNPIPSDLVRKLALKSLASL